MGKFGVRLKATVAETTPSAILSVSVAESIVLKLHATDACVIQLFGDIIKCGLPQVNFNFYVTENIG